MTDERLAENDPSALFSDGLERNEAARRRLRRLMMVFVAFAVGLAVVAWFWVTQPLFSVKTGPETVSFDAKRLEAHVRMLAETHSPRDHAHPENLDKVAAYVRDEFKRAGGAISEQVYKVRSVEYRNVIAFFGPETKDRIVVGAHYDVCGPHPGADDNASAVAGLVELAHRLGKEPPKTRVELVAYTLEEPPYFRTEHMGSAVHAKSLKAQGVSVRLMMSLEMIGFFTDAPNSQHYPLPGLGAVYPSRGNYVAVVGTSGHVSVVRRIKAAMTGASSLPVYSINAPSSVPGLDFSDQLNYWAVGYDAVMITDTAFFRNPNYHTSDDTPEKLDYRRMAMVVEGVHAAVVEFSK